MTLRELAEHLLVLADEHGNVPVYVTDDTDREQITDGWITYDFINETIEIASPFWRTR